MENQIIKFEANMEIVNAFAVKEVSDENPEIRYTTTTDTAKLFNALRGKSLKVKDFIGETFDIVDIVISASDVHEDKNNEDSPMVNRPVVHFFTSDGKHISTLSNGIARNVKALFEIGLIPTNESPMKIRFDEIETKNGMAHIFELV